MTLVGAQPPDLVPPDSEPAVEPITPIASVGCGVVWPPLDLLAASKVASSLVAAQPGGKQATAAPGGWDIVDEWGMDSFPASDPPANW